MRIARRGGFTLVELLIAAAVIGILAGIAVPVLRNAITKADAAHIVSDVRIVDLAVQQYIEENGTLPGTSAWGAAPTDLAAYIPDMTFVYETTDYRLVSNTGTGTVLLRVRYPVNDRIGQGLSAYERPGIVVWTSVRTDFYLVN